MGNKSLLGAINSILIINKLYLKLSPGKGKLACCVQTFPAIIRWKSHPQVRLFVQPHKFCYDGPVYCFRRHFRGNSDLQNKKQHMMALNYSKGNNNRNNEQKSLRPKFKGLINGTTRKRTAAKAGTPPIRGKSQDKLKCSQ